MSKVSSLKSVEKSLNNIEKSYKAFFKKNSEISYGIIALIILYIICVSFCPADVLKYF